MALPASEPMSGDVIGFRAGLRRCSDTANLVELGDTVWYDGVAEVARRFPVGVVVLFAGAAQTRGPFHLTMDTNDAIETAHALPAALIVPIAMTDGRISPRTAPTSSKHPRRSDSLAPGNAEARRCDADRFGEMIERWRPCRVLRIRVTSA